MCVGHQISHTSVYSTCCKSAVLCTAQYCSLYKLEPSQFLLISVKNSFGQQSYY